MRREFLESALADRQGFTKSARFWFWHCQGNESVSCAVRPVPGPPGPGVGVRRVHDMPLNGRAGPRFRSARKRKNNRLPNIWTSLARAFFVLQLGRCSSEFLWHVCLQRATFSLGDVTHPNCILSLKTRPCEHDPAVLAASLFVSSRLC